MYKIGIRADGGSSVGMGHIMRCLVLAEELQKAGNKIYFISKFDQGIKKIEEQGFEVFTLKCDNVKDNKFHYGDTNDLENDVCLLSNLISVSKIDALIIDSYNVNEQFLLKLKRFIRTLIYIDDINSFDYPVDIVINGNITAMEYKYKKYFNNQCFLLGPKYCLIRREFFDIPERFTNKIVKNIMVTTGGADPYNITENLLDFLLQHFTNDVSFFNVIIGSGFKYKDDVIKKFKKYQNVILYENIKEISQVMLKSDIAISSGGSTLYELSMCGVPTLSFIYAQNQELIVKCMEQMGYIFNIGWYNDLQTDKIVNLLNSLISNFNLRDNISKKMRSLIDGKGATRTVEIIMKKLGENTNE